MKKGLKFDKSNYQKLVIVGILLVIMLALTLLSKDFLTPANVTNVFRQVAATVIVGCGVTMLMVAGNFDLSIGSIMAISGVMAALMVSNGFPIAVAILICIVIGVIVGLINGFLVVLLHVPSIIATLGSMYAVRGAAWVITGGNSISRGLGKSFTVLGRGYLGPVHISILITAVVFALFYFIQHKTLLGKYSYAIGGNRRTALLSGINVRLVGVTLYVLVGALSAVAGVMMASRLGVGNASMGDGFEFDVVVAVVLGGTSLDGGEGSVFGMLIGALIVGFIANGLNLLGVHSFYQDIVKGIVLVGAVLLDRLLQSRIQS